MGRFLVTEGLDGSGTSTQARLLAEGLKSQGRTVWLTAEPTEGPIGKLIRQYLGGALSLSGEDRWDRRQMALLFAADRQDHLAAANEGIEARLARDEDVVCARYLLSSLAYEGENDDEFTFVDDLNRDFRRPDLTLFLDCPVEVSLERLGARKDLEIFENREKLERVARGYRRALTVTSSPVLIADAQRPAQTITDDALEVLEQGAPR